jgi:hypothetical protein
VHLFVVSLLDIFLLGIIFYAAGGAGSGFGNVLIIPVTYINEDNEVVLEDGSKKSVETGFRDLNYVEILSGLEEGDVVLKPES